MADGRHLENRPYLRNVSTDLCEIWHDDAYWASIGCLSQTNQRRAQRVPAVPGIVRDKQERSELDPSEHALATFTPARIIN